MNVKTPQGICEDLACCSPTFSTSSVRRSFLQEMNSDEINKSQASSGEINYLVVGSNLTEKEDIYIIEIFLESSND